ncbi:hypothetical protein BJX65DRAFT_262798 [Aspergillus insuetus]
MIRSCKVDTCLDLFIARVLSFVSEQNDTTPQPSPYRFSNDLDNVPEEKLKEVEKELQDNLNRLITEYVSENTQDMPKRVKKLARREVPDREGISRRKRSLLRVPNPQMMLAGTSLTVRYRH